jgi:hypothetical protein
MRELESVKRPPALRAVTWQREIVLRRMKGPPLSPGQAWTSGARRDVRSCPQISDAMIAWGYARLQAPAEMTFMCPSGGASAGT